VSLGKLFRFFVIRCSTSLRNVSLIQFDSHKALRCYSCSTTAQSSDTKCLNDPISAEGQSVVNCNKKYCTILRQELKVSTTRENEVKHPNPPRADNVREIFRSPCGKIASRNKCGRKADSEEAEARKYHVTVGQANLFSMFTDVIISEFSVPSPALSIEISHCSGSGGNFITQ
jgi:hypothetical protein